MDFFTCSELPSDVILRCMLHTDASTFTQLSRLSKQYAELGEEDGFIRRWLLLTSPDDMALMWAVVIRKGHLPPEHVRHKKITELRLVLESDACVARLGQSQIDSVLLLAFEHWDRAAVNKLFPHTTLYITLGEPPQPIISDPVSQHASLHYNWFRAWSPIYNHLASFKPQWGMCEQVSSIRLYGSEDDHGGIKFGTGQYRKGGQTVDRRFTLTQRDVPADPRDLMEPVREIPGATVWIGAPKESTGVRVVSVSGVGREVPSHRSATGLDGFDGFIQLGRSRMLSYKQFVFGTL